MNRLHCLLKGHHWDRGACTHCGSSHKDHQWHHNTENCRVECLICGKRQEIKHSWDGCHCAVCGVTKITLGQPTKDVDHQWVQLQGQCTAKCAHCTATKPIKHQFLHHTCTGCGLLEDDYLRGQIDSFLAQAKTCGVRQVELQYIRQALDCAERIHDPNYLNELKESKEHHDFFAIWLSKVDDETLVGVATNRNRGWYNRKRALARISTQRKQLEPERFERILSEIEAAEREADEARDRAMIKLDSRNY